MPSFHVSSDQRHLAWDNSLPPALTVPAGAEIVLDLFDSSGGQLTREDDASAVGRLDMSAVNPCTGPIFVEGAEPGDDLVVTVLEIETRDWAWTANIPHFGLLADDFPDPVLSISTVADELVTMPSGVAIPVRPMIGTIGVAPGAPGQTPLLVPSANGGNMDIAQIGAGTTVHFPVAVPGALLSAGDAHAVQGDGEVCGTGAETAATVGIRVDLVTGAATATPWYSHWVGRQEIDWIATTGIAPDLFAASREATRRAVDLVSAGAGLDPVDAYLLLSLVGELRISEIVDAPNWVVSMHVPTRYTRS